MLKKYKAYLFMLPIFIIGFVVILFATKNKTNETILAYDTNEIIEKQENEEEIKEENKKEIKTIKVDVKGEVNNPGVYELQEGKRVNDAIELSGGITENADTKLINLSKTLKDEMVIIVYNKYEIEKLKQSNVEIKTVVEYIEKECNCPDQINDACINKSNNSKEQKTENNESNGKININTAKKEDLLNIKGIGETKADAIIKYRNENGLFKDINDIKNISGIGESTFEKIKDFITI